MPAAEAAAYVSIPVAEFERLGIGLVRMGTKVRYDRVATDRHLDALAGISAPSPAQEADNDPEAAFDRSRPDLRHASRRP